MWEKIKIKCNEYNIHMLFNWFNDNTLSNKIPLYAGLLPKVFDFNLLDKEDQLNLYNEISLIVIESSFEIWNERNNIIYTNNLSYKQRQRT